MEIRDESRPGGPRPTTTTNAMIAKIQKHATYDDRLTVRHIAKIRPKQKELKAELPKNQRYFTRHDGYYVFITNKTVMAEELASLSPVYHDEEPSPSYQNTIVFPGGRDGIQVFLYVNETNPRTENFVVIEPCEVEIYGCVYEESENCTCPSEVAEDSFSKTLWNSTVVFEHGTFSLRCDNNYLSLMNVGELENSQTNLMLAECDGKQQCSYKTDSNIQGQSINFYCHDRCINENYNNTRFKYNLDEDFQYRPDVREPFTGYLKSRVFECDERHVLTDGNLTLQCRENGTWSGKPPVCNVTCMEPVHENRSTILEYGHLPIYFEDENVTYKCRKNHRHVDGNLIRLCNKSGDWTGKKPVCKRCKCPCDRVKYQNFISDPQILEKRLEDMKKELEVHKEKLSKTVRAKTCAKDERTSSKRLGSVLGVGIIVSVLMFICCSDLPLLCRHIRYGP
ncbi:uncharacterized protein LOC134240182 [Saccostrea cucullata]|uniref:uncharacterized protein LOC134240182 n=1 Tax=Saccostrea cuccullata TaxID=36930 RepID=UPI002ECFDD07